VLVARRVAGILMLVASGAAVTWWLLGDHIRARWPRLVQPRSPHERYARALENANLHGTALGRDWLEAASTALRDPRSATAPFSAEGTFEAGAPTAVAWRFGVAHGRRVEVRVEFEGAGEIFVDLFHQASERLARVHSATAGAAALDYEPPEDGTYVLRVQPELLRGGRYAVRQRAVATLQFPVQGLTPRAVQSRYGDQRDSGVRAHEGVDIFAPRGTPALAAADGWVTRVTTNRLGGNVVWVWDPERGQALYYAHLDRQDVSTGVRVKAGDVIGRVGNTGNARTTPPHLHFGIYRPLEGAIDPLPFICDAPCGTRGMAYAQ
jgi:murein DD-endopeptidase MepM/ murein hydrolase activator NlpD